MSFLRGQYFLCLLGVCAFAVLISLGLWQLHRRDWKAGVIARIEHAMTEKPEPYAPDTSGTDASREFRPVQVEGLFLPQSSLKELVPTPQAMQAFTKEGFGYLIFSPLDFGQGVVFVNRGFVPASLAETFLTGEPKKTAVKGLLRAPQPPGSFTPKAEIEKKLFYTADIPAMAAVAGLPPSRTVTGEYIEADASPNEGGWPKGRDPQSLIAIIPNSHLQYALTWFGIAAGLAGVLIAYLWTGRHRKRFEQS